MNYARVMAAATILALYAGAAQPAAAGAASIEAGRKLAERSCGACHAVGLAGPSPNGKAPVLRELYKRYPMGRIGAAIREGLLTTHKAMPVMRFDERELSQLVAYLNSIQAPNREPKGI